MELESESAATASVDALSVGEGLALAAPSGGTVSEAVGGVAEATGAPARRVVLSEAAPSFKSESLTLGGTIGLNFFVDLSCLTEEEKERCYVDFEVGEGRYATEATDAFDPGFTSSNGTLYGFTCPVTSVQMADEVVATLRYTTQGRQREVTKTYSVKEYVGYFSLHRSEYSARTMAVIYSIFDYGHYVQPYLSENNGWTLGPDHMDFNWWVTLFFDYAATAEALAPLAFQKKDPWNALEEATCRLNLRSGTSLQFYFRAKDGADVDASCTFRGATYRAEQQEDGRWRLVVPDIPAHLLGSAVTISGTAGGKPFSVRGSAYSYAEGAMRGSAPGDGLNYESRTPERDAMCALYAYGEAVVASRT